jgi:hypothetical protein
MQGPTKPRWQILCERAANEQDPDELLKLVKEINDLLSARQKRLSDDRDKQRGGLS